MWILKLRKDALSELSGDSDDITEGSTNLFFTNARADARITWKISDDEDICLLTVQQDFLHNNQ